MLCSGSLFGQACDFVVGTYLATHVYRLCEHDGGSCYVAGVCAEGIHDALSAIVEQRLHACEHAVESRGGALHHGLSHLAEHRRIRDELQQLWVLLQELHHFWPAQHLCQLWARHELCQTLTEFCHALLYTVSECCGSVGAKVYELVLLLVAEQLYLSAGALVCSDGRDAWIIVRLRRLVLPVCGFHLEGAHAEFFIVAKCQCTAAVERQCLCRHCCGSGERGGK